jgi:16S rRNA (cytosine967-C5)-methyltransferase
MGSAEGAVAAAATQARIEAISEQSRMREEAISQARIEAAQAQAQAAEAQAEASSARAAAQADAAAALERARTADKEKVIAALEASTWSDTRQFDAVLLDAPCSATGTYRRNPDVMWAARPGDIPALALVQARLLESATDRVKPGGQLVYCVCSLEPEEGEAQVQAFLSRTPSFSLEPISPGEGGSPVQSRLENGTLRILPHHREGGTDGFFIARFRKAS